MAVKLVKPINHKKVVKITNQDFEAKMRELRVNSDIAVAVSGGPDSLALMHLSNRYALNNNINLTVLSIDHGIRAESSKEIVWLEKIAKKNKINFYSTKLKKKINSSNTLSKARTLRYEALSKYCDKKKIKLLNFAHHYEYEESGLNIVDLRKFIAEKRVVYDHKEDSRSYKWSGKSILKNLDVSLLPDYISSNLDKFSNWLD